MKKWIILFLMSSVLKGDLVDAVRTARSMHTIWKDNGFTPECLNLLSGKALQDQEG